MTTGQLADRLKVSRETIRNYASEFADYLSPEAVGVAANAKRRYSDKDALTLATIARLRANGQNYESIRGALDNGQLLEALPPVPSEAEKEARENVALVVRPEYERVLDRVGQLEGELENLRAERDRAIATWQGDVTRLNERIAILEREKGLIEGELTALKAERLPIRTTLQIAAVITIGMLVLVLIAVVLLAGRGGG